MKAYEIYFRNYEFSLTKLKNTSLKLILQFNIGHLDLQQKYKCLKTATYLSKPTMKCFCFHETKQEPPQAALQKQKKRK